MPVTHHLQSFVHLFTFRRGSSSVSAGRRPLRTAVVSPLTTLAETVTSTLLISKGIATPRLYPSFASWRFCTCNIWLVCQLACPRLKHLVNSRPRCELCTRPQHLFSLTPKHVPSTRPKPCKYNVLVSRRNLGEIRTHALFYVFSHMHVYHSINSISSLRYMLIYHCSLSLSVVTKWHNMRLLKNGLSWLVLTYPCRHQGDVFPSPVGFRQEMAYVVVGAGIDGVDVRVVGKWPVGILA